MSLSKKSTKENQCQWTTEILVRQVSYWQVFNRPHYDLLFHTALIKVVNNTALAQHSEMQVTGNQIARNSHILLPYWLPLIARNMNNNYTQIAGIPVMAGKLASLSISRPSPSTDSSNIAKWGGGLTVCLLPAWAMHCYLSLTIIGSMYLRCQNHIHLYLIWLLDT